MDKFRRYNPQLNKFTLVEKEQLWLNNIPNFELYMSIDGSSSNTGISLVDGTDSLVGTAAIHRNNNEDYVEYKIRLKRILMELMENNIRVMKHIYYEEPFVGFAVATEVLMALRTTIKEIKIENSPKFDHIKFTEVNNMKWKRIFLDPLAVPTGSHNQKLAVQKKVVQLFGSICLEDGVNGQPGKLMFTEDECDSIGLGLACALVRRKGLEEEELKTKKKAKPFKYNIEYMPVRAEDIEEAELWMLDNFEKYRQAWRIPERVIENGICVVELTGRGLFDNHVYSNMGQEDKLLMMEFPAGKYVDAVIRNGRSDMCREYDKNEFMFAFVWRKARK